MRFDSEYYSKFQKFVPAILQDRLIRTFYRMRSPFYRGDNVFCECCGRHHSQFLAPYDECPGCGSQARQRLMLSYLRNETQLFSSKHKLLHFAPEMSLEGIFKSATEIDYLSADLFLPRAMVKVDMTNIDYADGTFDVVLCSHVLEHIPEDIKAMSELYRVLAHGGWAILQVPIDRNREETYEDFSITDPGEREKHFGRFDHCRVYGADYKLRLEQAGFEVIVDEYVERFSNDDAIQYGFDTQEQIYLCRKS